MQITFESLHLTEFKNHRDLLIEFGPITRITGANGAGKSTIGEAIAWNLYGTDPLGNTLTKNLSPEPVDREFDRVEVKLRLKVDGQEFELTRGIEGGDMVYHINDVPVKATPYKQQVDSLFDKPLFLSLFTPAYFFSQKWEEQRSLVLKNVLPPASKDVLKDLPKAQADKLAEALKKHNIDDLEAKHKDNRTRQDKALIAAKAIVRTLQEQLDLSPALTEAEAHELTAKVADIDVRIAEFIKAQEAANKAHAEFTRLRAQRDSIRLSADRVATNYKSLKANPPADHCNACKQPLQEDSLKAAVESHNAELSRLKLQHEELLAKFKELTAFIGDIGIADFDPDELHLLQTTRSDLAAKLQAASSSERLKQQLEAAKAAEKETQTSHAESVFLLDAIKAFRAQEAELMADKVTGLFKTLTIQLFQENKGDGERKPFFEIFKDGKPYRKLSTAEKILAGLEIIDVLSEQSGVIAPTFIDNAESILTYKQPAGQLIECRVADTPLTISEV